MNKPTDVFAYMMAAEKMVNLLFVMEQTLEFMAEYRIQPDEQVVKLLTPKLDQMKKWVESGKSV